MHFNNLKIVVCKIYYIIFDVMISYLYEIKYALVHYGNVKYLRAHKINLIFQGALSQVDESHLHDYAKLERKRS